MKENKGVASKNQKKSKKVWRPKIRRKADVLFFLLRKASNFLNYEFHSKADSAVRRLDFSYLKKKCIHSCYVSILKF